MEDLISWIGSPKAYNWITLFGASAAIMTAAFTGYSAVAQRRDRRKYIHIEWLHTFGEKSVLVACEVTNRTDTTLKGERIDVKGLDASIDQHSRPHKLESWKIASAPAMIEVAPGNTGKVTFEIIPNPSSLRSQASSYLHKPRGWIAKSLWHWLQWKIPFGPSLSIKLTLRRRSSAMRPISFTHTIRIYPEIAMKMAANIEAKADKT